MATYWTMRGGPAAEPPGTGPEKETTEKEELPQNGNIQDEEGEGEPAAKPPGILPKGGKRARLSGKMK